MPRIFTSDLSFPYAWAQTALGVLHKYPNPHATHVVSMDVIDQQYDVGTGRVRLERVIGVRQSAPRWVVKLLSLAEDTYVREVAMFDPANAQVEMTSTNMTLSEYLLVKEYITYRPPAAPASPHSPSPSSSSSPSSFASPPASASASASAPSTSFHQVAHISSQGALSSAGGASGIMAKAGRKLEDSSFDRFGSNASRGREGLMEVLRRLWGEAGR